MPAKTALNNQAQDLTPEEIAKLKSLSLAQRDRLYNKERERKAEGAYEISRDDIADEADLAAVETNQEVNIKLAEVEREKLTLIEASLKKIENGTYGYCEGTGEVISFKRLLVQPWARYSLRHQEDIERGKRPS